MVSVEMARDVGDVLFCFCLLGIYLAPACSKKTMNTDACPETTVSLCSKYLNILNILRIMACIKKAGEEGNVLFRLCLLGIYSAQACSKIHSRRTHVQRLSSLSTQNLQIHSMFLGPQHSPKRRKTS
jgi:hypothetical protein